MATGVSDDHQPSPVRDETVADAAAGSLVESAPAKLRPYLRLARYDRPVGFWLLAAPCWVGLGLARLGGGWSWADAGLAILFGIGAIAMRGAGCTFNDMVDRDLDAQVARTAARPLASGALSMRAAALFLAVQCLVGLAVLAALPREAQVMALCAVPLVAIYPFMKRITWFPQAWLGLTFNWGVLVGFLAAGGWNWPAVVAVYLGLAAWTFGYDTIYAHQDKEDDALIGVKSTARLFGPRSRLAVAVSYALAALLVAGGVVFAGLGASFQTGPLRDAALWGGTIAASLFALHLAIQVTLVRFDDGRSCLFWFKSNREAGLVLAVSLAGLPALVGLAQV